MRAPLIVKSQILAKRNASFGDVVVGAQIDLLVLDATPQALDKNIISRGAFAIHADRDFRIEQHAGEGEAGEQAALLTGA